MKKIVLVGATGLIGKKLFTVLRDKQYDVIVVSRDAKRAREKLPDAQAHVELHDEKGLIHAIDGSIGVINLAGAPIAGKRWNEKYKKLLVDSRIKTTQLVVNAIARVPTKPQVLLNGSAVGYYGNTTILTPVTESAPAGSDFLAKLCVAWEEEAQKVREFAVRVVMIRTAIVLDTREGALPLMSLPFKFFMGGPIGSGKQPFPWIHVDDEVGILMFALEQVSVAGPINSAATEQVDNKTFSHILGKVLHRPSFFVLPEFVLKPLVGEATSSLTHGVAISTQKISNLGYHFHFPTLEEALRDVFK